MNTKLHGYALFVACATFCLIVAGGLVTSTGSGLAVPDWPLSYGQLFPPMVGGVFFEHGHRLIAALVGLLTFILTIWMWAKEKRHYLRHMATITFLVIVLQGILGGITVLFMLPTPVSVAHACLGQMFFCLVVSIALLTSPMWHNLKPLPNHKMGSSITFLSLGTTIAIYLQLVLGAIMRHTEAGLAIPDFPLAFGQLLPPIVSHQIAIHFFHRVWGMAVFISVLALFLKVQKSHLLQQRWVSLIYLLFGFVFLQITLGAFTIWSAKAVFPTTAHVACGALILSTSLIFTILAGRYYGFPKVRFLLDYLALGKPKITFLVCLTTMAGFLLASPTGRVNYYSLMWTLVSTALVAFGASTFNQLMEHHFDKLMNRTALRPLPAGRLTVKQAFWVGMGTSILGLVIFLKEVNLLSTLLAGLTLLSYLFLYTPLKRFTPFCTLVGAIPGAIPPMIGWASAQGSLSIGAWVLFGILFLWQLPHFLAIAWLYMDDYSRAQFPMLPVVDQTGDITARQLFLYCSALLPLALLPTLLGMTGLVYFAGALLLSLLFLMLGVYFMKYKSMVCARRLLLGSVLYLPFLLILMVIDKVG